MVGALCSLRYTRVHHYARPSLGSGADPNVRPGGCDAYLPEPELRPRTCTGRASAGLCVARSQYQG